MEHPALYAGRRRGWIRGVARSTLDVANAELDRRVRRVRSRDRVARRTIPQPEAARSCAGLYASVLLAGRDPSFCGELRGELLQRVAPDHLWKPFAVALHADLGGAACHSAGDHPAVLAALARVGTRQQGG